MAQASPSESVASESTSPKLGTGILRQPVFSAPVLAKDPAVETKTTVPKPSFLQQPRFGGFGLTPPSEGSPGSGGTGGDAGGKSKLKELLFGGSKPSLPSVVSSSAGVGAVETSSGKAG